MILLDNYQHGGSEIKLLEKLCYEAVSFDNRVLVSQLNLSNYIQ